MEKNKFKLQEEVSSHIFKNKIVPEEFKNIESSKDPTAVLVRGQPGSGKTFAYSNIKMQYEDSLIEINGDNFRKYHPHYDYINNTYKEKASYFTDIDSGIWVERSIDMCLKQGSSMLIEGTLRIPSQTIDFSHECSNAGFSVDLYLMGVNHIVSRARIFHRYIDQCKTSNSAGRYTLPDAHNTPYVNIALHSKDVIERGKFRNIFVVDERGSLEGGKGDIDGLIKCLNEKRKIKGSRLNEVLDDLMTIKGDIEKFGGVNVSKDFNVLLDDIRELRIKTLGLITLNDVKRR